MLRTTKVTESSSSPSSSEWTRLCRSKDWPTLLLRAVQLKQQQQKQANGNSHDNIMADRYSIYESIIISDSPKNTPSSSLSCLSSPLGTSILSLAVRAGAPLAVLDSLIQLDPQQLYQVTTTSTSSSYSNSNSSSSSSVTKELPENISSSFDDSCDSGGSRSSSSHEHSSLPRGITILHDAVRYCCIRGAHLLNASSSVDEHHDHHGDGHCGWEILEFLVDRILQQHQLEGNNEQESSQMRKQQQEESSSSSWLIGSSRRDRYSTTTTTLPAVTCRSLPFHVNCPGATNELFAIQDNSGRTVLHYLVEQQLRQIQLLLSTTSSVTNNTFHDDDDVDTDELNGEQCFSSAFPPSISYILEASWRAFEKMITANPSVMQIMDSDGNTALVLLLAAASTHVATAPTPAAVRLPRHDNNNNNNASSSAIARQRHHSSMVESEILRRVQRMLTLCPLQVALSRKVPSSRKAVSWRIPQWHQEQQQQPSSALVTTDNNIIISVDSSTSAHLADACITCTTLASAAATDPTSFPVHGLPLYYALLYGRCPETILELVRAQRGILYNGCSVVVTQYAEYCLHIAATRRAPLAVLKLIVDEYPAATLTPDIYGLTPLEWLWMTYVMEWHQAISVQLNNDHGPDEWAFSLLSPSRRRFLHRDYMDWYNEVLNHHCAPYSADRYDLMDTNTGRSMQNELLKRMQILLPRAAAEIAVAPMLAGSGLDNISLVHAACRLCGCIPRGMLQMVLAMDPEAKVQLRSPDSAGRYPLHYAAAAAPVTGYRASLPLGISRGVSLLQEESPVALALSHFPEASRATDCNGQLPLHIAIDAAKNQAQDCHGHMDHLSASPCTDAATAAVSAAAPALSHEKENTVLDLLLSHWPESIRQRDGKTRLLPWQQAAVGDGASLQTIFTLLRRDPTCISH